MENNEEAMLEAVDKRDVLRVMELVKGRGVDVNYASGGVRLIKDKMNDIFAYLLSLGSHQNCSLYCCS